MRTVPYGPQPLLFCSEYDFLLRTVKFYCGKCASRKSGFTLVTFSQFKCGKCASRKSGYFQSILLRNMILSCGYFHSCRPASLSSNGGFVQCPASKLVNVHTTKFVTRAVSSNGAGIRHCLLDDKAHQHCHRSDDTRCGDCVQSRCDTCHGLMKFGQQTYSVLTSGLTCLSSHYLT